MYVNIMYHRGKRGQHSQWMLAWVSSILHLKHPLSGADPDSHSTLHVVPLYMNQKERATADTWGSITRLTPDGLGQLTTYERGTPIINPSAGDAHQPWLATCLGEGNSDLKPTTQELAVTSPAC